MNILGIYTEDYPWDVRIQKVFGGLAARGHRVRLVARNLDRSPERETVDGMECVRVPARRLPGPLQGLASVPAFFHPAWRGTALREARRLGADLVLVRDLPLALAGLHVARRLRIPCVIDMAENHPEMWREVLRADRWKIGPFLMKNYLLGKWMERKVARTADLIFVVVEEMRDHLVSVGADPDRVFVVSNTPTVVPPERAPNPAPADDPLRIAFTGFVTERRGLRVVLEALAKLAAEGPAVEFHIVGSGDADDALRACARELGVGERVVWHGWVDHGKMHSLLDGFDVGIVPHPRTGEIEYTIPNKIFDYMAHSLPVIVSDVRPLKRTVEKENCGMAFADGDAGSLADVIRKLADPRLRADLGSNGRAAVVRRYHWDHDFRTVRTQVESFATDPTGRRQRGRPDPSPE